MIKKIHSVVLVFFLEVEKITYFEKRVPASSFFFFFFYLLIFYYSFIKMISYPYFLVVVRVKHFDDNKFYSKVVIKELT